MKGFGRGRLACELLFVTELPLDFVLGLTVGLATGGAVSVGGEVAVSFDCKLHCVFVRSHILSQMI